MDEWSKTIWIFVELIVASLLLMSGVVLGKISGDIGRIQQREIDAIAVTKEYRLYNRYDHEKVKTQDIISLILESKGKPEVWVDDIPGPGENYNNLKWTTTIPINDNRWKLTHITTLLPATGTFTSSLERNANGEIVTIKFGRD